MESEVVQLPLADQLWVWFQKNKKPAILGASVVVIVGLVVWFVVYQRDQRQVEASEALSGVVAAQVNAPGGVQSAGAASAYLKVASQYPNSGAAGRAVLMAAGSLFAEGKYDEAKAQFQRFTHENHSSPFMGEAMLGIASCLEAQKHTQDAITAYKELVDRHPSEAVLLQARFALGRLSQAQNQPEQALNYFEQVAQADPYGSLGAEAGMRAEELKLQHPNLVAPPAVPGAAMATKSVTVTPSNAAVTPVPAKK